MNLKTKHFGKYLDKDIQQFILENDRGMVVKVMDYGATITSITMPDKNGNPVSLVCGFDRFEDYLSEEYKANAPYFGSTVGRYCSQIKDAQFTLDGQEYKLAANCGNNNLHGGTVGFDKKIWTAQTLESDDAVGIRFGLFSADREEGFPGNVEASVELKLTNDNEIVIEYKATTDKATPLSMTNHSYFNLSGFQNTVENYSVKVKTNQLLEQDESAAATGKVKDVTNTAEDLREGRIVKDVQEAIGDGFEHFYVFDNPSQNLISVAEVSDAISGRKLEVFSTEPCMLFYTGKYTSDQLQRDDAERYGKYRGFACETHRWQNGPNISEAPGTITRPGQNFTSKTIFKISE